MQITNKSACLKDFNPHCFTENVHPLCQLLKSGHESQADKRCDIGLRTEKFIAVLVIDTYLVDERGASIHIDTYIGRELVRNTGKDRNGLVLANAIRDWAILLKAKTIGSVCSAEPGFPVLVDGVGEFEARGAGWACAGGIDEAEAFGHLPVDGDVGKHSGFFDVRVKTRAEADDCVRPECHRQRPPQHHRIARRPI